MGMPCSPKISPTVMQSHDARLALRGRIPLEAHNQSLALTADQLDAARAAVLDKTLTMLTARGSWPLRQLLLRPTTGILVTAVSITTLLLAVPALGLSPWWTLIALGLCHAPGDAVSGAARGAKPGHHTGGGSQPGKCRLRFLTAGDEHTSTPAAART